MGMLGSESALDELMAKILGDLIHKGIVLRRADDNYVDFDHIGELFSTWEKVFPVSFGFWGSFGF